MRLILTGVKKCIEMKRYILLFAVIIISAVTLNAQDLELNKLTDIVTSLRKGGEKAYNDAIAKLAEDEMWTPMDELTIDRNIECRVSDRVPGFRLNSAMNNAENKNRYQTTTGNHLNGADSRYNYSLFEKTLKAGKTASFNLTERWGTQVFIVIPYPGEKSKMSVSASSDGKIFTITQMGNGMMKLSGVAVKGKPVNLKVTNESGENISYVILNYNSRK